MQYLLERLAIAGQRAHGTPSRFDLRAAVREQLQRVVTSHFWPGAPGLQLMGHNLPPLAGFGYTARADVTRYSAGIRELVLAHEPRLSNVQVSVAATTSALAPLEVVVTGELKGHDGPDTFHFELPRR